MRIKFAGIKSGKRQQLQDDGRLEEDVDDEHGWEEQQIRKAMASKSGPAFGGENLLPPSTSGSAVPSPREDTFEAERMERPSAVSYNLEGIKGRLQQRRVDLGQADHVKNRNYILNDLVKIYFQVTLETSLLCSYPNACWDSNPRLNNLKSVSTTTTTTFVSSPP